MIRLYLLRMGSLAILRELVSRELALIASPRLGASKLHMERTRSMLAEQVCRAEEDSGSVGTWN